MESEEPWPAINDQMQRMMVNGVRTWRGPGFRPHLIAGILGCSGPDEFYALCSRLEAKLDKRRHLTSLEWAQVLFITEVAFTSRVGGQGSQWFAVTGVTDLEALVALRQLQRSLRNVVAIVDEAPFVRPDAWQARRKRG